MTSVWGVNAVAILDSSVNCLWWTKKVHYAGLLCPRTVTIRTETTPGITMHELPRNRPAVTRGESGLSLYNSNELTFMLRGRITPTSCVESTSVSAISQGPMPIPHVEADTMFQYSFKILPDRLKLSDTAVSLWVSRANWHGISFIFGARVGHFAATPQSDVV